MRSVAAIGMIAVAWGAGTGAARADVTATPDYSAGVAVRSVPLGSAVYGELGYDVPVWGERNGGNVLYGFVRPLARASTSIVVNRLDLAIEAYPVSFWSLRAGYAGSSRMTDVDTVDCTLNACRGTVGTAYASSQLLFGYGPIFGEASLAFARLTPSRTGTPFADEQTSLIGLDGGDRMVSQELIVGARISDGLSVGAYFSAGHMLGTSSANDQQSLFGKLERGAWTYALGAGAYESTTYARGFTAFGAIEWTGIPSLGLK